MNLTMLRAGNHVVFHLENIAGHSFKIAAAGVESTHYQVTAAKGSPFTSRMLSF
jgi:hypothetical protein